MKKQDKTQFAQFRDALRELYGITDRDQVKALYNAGYEAAKDAHTDLYKQGFFDIHTDREFREMCYAMGTDFVLENPELFDIEESASDEEIEAANKAVQAAIWTANDAWFNENQPNPYTDLIARSEYMHNYVIAHTTDRERELTYITF